MLCLPTAYLVFRRAGSFRRPLMAMHSAAVSVRSYSSFGSDETVGFCKTLRFSSSRSPSAVYVRCSRTGTLRYTFCRVDETGPLESLRLLSYSGLALRCMRCSLLLSVNLEAVNIHTFRTFHWLSYSSVGLQTSLRRYGQIIATTMETSVTAGGAE